MRRPITLLVLNGLAVLPATVEVRTWTGAPQVDGSRRTACQQAVDAEPASPLELADLWCLAPPMLPETPVEDAP